MTPIAPHLATLVADIARTPLRVDAIEILPAEAAP